MDPAGIAVPSVEKVNLAEKLGTFSELWEPKVAGTVNDFAVKVVKVKGEFVWHRHEREDELFLVLRGRITVQLRDRNVELGEGEFIVVPRGVEHCPMAEDEASVLLLEPTSTINTGNVRSARTRTELERI